MIFNVYFFSEGAQKSEGKPIFSDFSRRAKIFPRLRRGSGLEILKFSGDKFPGVEIEFFTIFFRCEEIEFFKKAIPGVKRLSFSRNYFRVMNF